MHKMVIRAGFCLFSAIISEIMYICFCSLTMCMRCMHVKKVNVDLVLPDGQSLCSDHGSPGMPAVPAGPWQRATLPQL